MFQAQFNDPRMIKWQARLARVPRWAWIAFFIGGVIPAAVLAVFLLITFFVAGAIAVGAVLVASTLLGLMWRLLHHRSRDDGRRNVQIVVRSARVIDP